MIEIEQAVVIGFVALILVSMVLGTIQKVAIEREKTKQLELELSKIIAKKYSPEEVEQMASSKNE